MKRLSGDELEMAAALLKEGQLVAFPTETVYGLGACIFNPEAIGSIFKVKGRPSDNPLIAHVSSLAQVEEIAEDIPETFYRLAERFFPGPLTVILKRRSLVPGVVSAGLDSIAVRMPSHPLALKLIALVNEPLVAPSANLSGKPSATQAEHVLEDFEGKIAAVVDGGRTTIGIESTVISLLGEKPLLLRPGAITQEEIEQVLGLSIEAAPLGGPLRSPGMKYRHYAPQAPVKLFYTLSDLQNHLSTSPEQTPKMVLSREPLAIRFPEVDGFLLSAKEFYSLLRDADRKCYQEILILCDAEDQKDVALMNRITRSAGATIYEEDVDQITLLPKVQFLLGLS